ncbi:hypothetical protein HK096_010922 [Nowakowskiella sp. JEL0078]|nr:hypothetical protein HK096_010922 [Nowakowskiella sp. JEL0078]
MSEDLNVLYPPFPSSNMQKGFRILQLISGIISLVVQLKDFIEYPYFAVGLILIILFPFHVICLFFAFKSRPVASIRQLLVRRRWVVALDVIYSLFGAAFFIWDLVDVVLYSAYLAISFYAYMVSDLILLVGSVPSVYFLSQSLRLLANDIRKNTGNGTYPTYAHNLPPPMPYANNLPLPGPYANNLPPQAQYNIAHTPANMLQPNFPVPVPQSQGENMYLRTMPVGQGERAPGANPYVPLLPNEANYNTPGPEGNASNVNTESVTSMEIRQKEQEVAQLREKIRLQQLDKELSELRAQTSSD